MRDSLDITLRCHDSLLYHFGGKTIAHVQMICHGLSVLCRHPHQLTVLTESSECHHFVSEPVFMPVTYI